MMCEKSNQPNLTDRPRFPDWMRRKMPAAGKSTEVEKLLTDLGLQTVCQGAVCPNRGECFAKGVATFMILGSSCTRNCGFCAVENAQASPPSPDEPSDVAAAAAKLKLRHVVITSVTRDDLPRGGAEHFAETIQAVRTRVSDATIEVLTPDFLGSQDAIDIVLQAGPDVFNHNIETAPRLYGEVRPQANYQRSLDVLAYASREGIITKSGLMMGLGESDDEIHQVLIDLRGADVECVTLGQYLAPSADHAPIARFVSPEEFSEWEEIARQIGFRAVSAGTYVRSSYNAHELFAAATGES